MRVLTFIWQVTRPFRIYLIIPIIVMTVCAINITMRPYLTKLMIDSVVTHQGMSALRATWRIAALYIFFLFLIPIGWRIYDWCSLKYEPALRNHIAKTMTCYLSEHSYHYFQNHFAGSLASKINDATNYIPAIITTCINRFYTCAVILIIAIYGLAHVHIWFAIAMTTWATIFITFVLCVLKKFNFLATITAEVSSRITGNIVDLFGNINSVRNFNGKNIEIKKLDKLQYEYLNAAQTRRWFMLKIYSVQGFLFIVYQTSCLLLLIYLFTQNKVTPGDFAMILALNISIVDGLWEMSNEVRTFSENVGTVNQALKTVYVPHEIIDVPRAQCLKITHGEIIFENVQFQYQEAEPLFENKSVRIAPGQKVGLVGFSGSGKSTFVHLILRLFDVTKGRILIDNQDIRTLTQSSLRQAICMIPQDPSLFHRSLLDNISYGKYDANLDEIINAAQRAHAHEFIQELQNGYDSLVGERGIKLSGGQRQRIAIARAILKNSPILILDEATSQLDSISEKYIQESLRDLMQGKTTIVVAHRLSTLLNMDRILVFDNGKIVQDGTHPELLGTEGLYKKLWNAQVGGFLIDSFEENIKII